MIDAWATTLQKLDDVAGANSNRHQEWPISFFRKIWATSTIEGRMTDWYYSGPEDFPNLRKTGFQPIADTSRIFLGRVISSKVPLFRPRCLVHRHRWEINKKVRINIYIMMPIQDWISETEIISISPLNGCKETINFQEIEFSLPRSSPDDDNLKEKNLTCHIISSFSETSSILTQRSTSNFRYILCLMYVYQTFIQPPLTHPSILLFNIQSHVPHKYKSDK